ncbi:efflux RND transporter permease subunit [Halalkalirubrum salinum]|uniref:efflux RND transporter permease subunit n=1 Tax=Halalkalirubrum salinum TaxID=2563889 RepID=UPI0010FB5C08|nr:MMPL family transporter [Halalkalirubrum salinum]
MTDEWKSKQVLSRIGRKAATNRKAVFAAVFLLIGVSVVGAAGVQMSLGMELYLEDDSETMHDWNEIQSDFNKGNVIFVVVETDEDTDLQDPETMRAFSSLYQSYYDEIDSAALVTSPAHPVKAGPGGGEIPDTKDGVLHSLEHTFGDHRSNMAVIANLYPDMQDHAEYQRVQAELESESYPVAVENGEEMFDSADTGVIIIQYGDVEIPDDREGDAFGFLPPSEDEIVEEQVREVTAASDLPEGTEVTVTGSPVFEEAAFGLLLPEMIQLFALALFVIVALVTVLMHGRLRRTRRVALPLATTLVALVAMLGMMGYVGFQFNAIMLGVMPVALGLGIDYGLQVQTRYVEEREAGQLPVAAAETAARTTGHALLLAFGTTVVGLGSLLAAEVPPVRQFGVTTAFSVGVAMILSLTLLIALLVTFDEGDPEPIASSDDRGHFGARADGGSPRPDGDTSIDTRDTSDTSVDSASDGALERGFDRMAGLLSVRTALVVLLASGLIIGGASAYPAVDTRTDMLDYWPDIEERQDIRELEATVPTPNVVYVIVETDDAYTHETFTDVQGFQHTLEEHDQIETVMSTPRAMEVGESSPPAAGPSSDQITEEGEPFREQLELRTRVDRPPQLGLTPEDHPDRLVIQVFVEDIEGQTEREVIDYIDDTAADELPAGYESRVTGQMVINRNVIENVTSGLTRTTLVSFGLGALFLGLVLRSPRESVVLVGTVAGSAFALTAGGMYLLGVPWNPLTVTTAAIVLGVGVTYGIHVYERFREEVDNGKPVEAAIRTAIVRKSRPVLGSGATTMLGFGVLSISAFPVLSNFGIAVALAMGMSLLTAFVFMPAVVLALARRGWLPA